MTKWYEHEKDEARGYQLQAPYDKIYVGSDPNDGMTKAAADSFDVYVNVSDSICTTFEPSRPGQHMHWYPVNECGRWNLSYLFWLKTILDYHHAAGHKVYLHCHAGAYRSPSAAVLWLQSRGHAAAEALAIGKEKGSGLYRLWEAQANIPVLKDEVFRLMNEHPKWSLGGILHETGDYWNHEVLSGQNRSMALRHKYFWFYYQPKWKLRRARERVRDWFRGLGYYTEGIGTWNYPRRYFWDWPQDAQPADPTEAVAWPRRTWDPETSSWKAPQ